MIDACYRKRAPKYFYIKKRKFYMEYVYQLLNGHPSNSWVNRQLKLGLKIKGFYNTESPYEVNRDMSILSKSVSDIESKFDNLKESFVSHRSMDNDFRKIVRTTMLNDNERYTPCGQKMYSTEELKALPVDIKPFAELSFFKKILRMFTPFELMYRKVWVTDAFIYPQVFMACVAICYFSLAYLTYETIRIIMSLQATIDSAYDQVNTSAYTFLRTGLQNYFVMFKYEPSTAELEPYYGKLDSLQAIVNQLTLALTIGCTIGMVFAFLAVTANTVWLCYDFRKIIINARTGKFRFDREMIDITASVNIAGSIITNSVFMYLLSIFVFTIIFTILAWPMTYIILWNMKWAIFSIVLAFVISFIQDKVLEHILYDENSIKRRWLLSVFDFLALQVSILASVVDAFMRIIILTFVFFTSLMRIDVTSLPQWVLKIYYIDDFNGAYYSALMMHHYHNHPVLITFYELMFLVTKPVLSNLEYDDETAAKLSRRKIIRNRLHLWLFLTKNPSLCQYRVTKNQDEGEGEGEAEGDGDEGNDTRDDSQENGIQYLQKKSHADDRSKTYEMDYQINLCEVEDRRTIQNDQKQDMSRMSTERHISFLSDLNADKNFETRINQSVYSEDRF